MTERTPPGRVSLAKVTINCAARRDKSRIVEAGYQGYRSAQDCPYTVSHAMLNEFAPHGRVRVKTVGSVGWIASSRIGHGASKSETFTLPFATD